MKIVAINGSPKRNGNTRHLLDAVLAPPKEAGWETEVVQVGGMDGIRWAEELFSAWPASNVARTRFWPYLRQSRDCCCRSAACG